MVAEAVFRGPLLLEDWASTHVSLLWHQRGTRLVYHDSTSCSSKVLIIISPASFRLVTFVVIFTKLQPCNRHRSDILFDGVRKKNSLSSVGPHTKNIPTALVPLIILWGSGFFGRNLDSQENMPRSREVQLQKVPPKGRMFRRVPQCTPNWTGFPGRARRCKFLGS